MGVEAKDNLYAKLNIINKAENNENGGKSANEAENTKTDSGKRYFIFSMERMREIEMIKNLVDPSPMIRNTIHMPLQQTPPPGKNIFLPVRVVSGFTATILNIHEARAFLDETKYEWV